MATLSVGVSKSSFSTLYGSPIHPLPRFPINPLQCSITPCFLVCPNPFTNQCLFYASFSSFFSIFFSVQTSIPFFPIFFSFFLVLSHPSGSSPHYTADLYRTINPIRAFPSHSPFFPLSSSTVQNFQSSTNKTRKPTTGIWV